MLFLALRHLLLQALRDVAADVALEALIARQVVVEAKVAEMLKSWRVLLVRCISFARPLPCCFRCLAMLLC